MMSLAKIINGFCRWIDSVAGSILDLFERFKPPRVVALVEDQNGDFPVQLDLLPDAQSNERIRFFNNEVICTSLKSVSAALSGARVELILQPSHFMFQPLDLPSRAVEFLGSIVRSQIDQLTPWTAADATFGWTKPAEVGTDRISITVAAAARVSVMPYVQAIAAAAPHSIAVFASLDESEPDAVPIKIFDQRARGTLDIAHIRRALMVIFLGTGLTAGAGIIASSIMGGEVEAQQTLIARRIASLRSAANAVHEGSSGSPEATLAALQRRKQGVPSAVVVLDILSQILPDHTYVTSLQIEQNQLRLTGLTSDAPSLIGLIEQSGRFARASFFSPTTRSPSDSREFFHIEAHIDSFGAPRS